MAPGGFPIKGPDNWRSAFLPGAFQGTFVNTEYATIEKLIENIRNPRLDRFSQRRQVDLLQALNRSHLQSRGLLDETLVICGGEFGRTPTVETRDGDGEMGRDHNPYGFSFLLAGGGVKGGTIHGATDEFGFKAVENTVHFHDLHATILYRMGLDHESLTYRYAGRDFRLTDVHGRVVRQIIS